LNDDSIKKLRDMLTGSLELMKKGSEKPKQNLSPEELANNFLTQLFESSWVEDELAATLSPSYSLSKKKSVHWLMNTQTKTLTYIKGGVEIVPIEQGRDSSICLIGQSTYIIPNDLVICSGWN
tara:strand:- start:57 stop:425 length:369 start_codon:yes stop_codon:yes gene_type:complete